MGSSSAAREWRIGSRLLDPGEESDEEESESESEWVAGWEWIPATGNRVGTTGRPAEGGRLDEVTCRKLRRQYLASYHVHYLNENACTYNPCMNSTHYTTLPAHDGEYR